MTVQVSRLPARRLNNLEWLLSVFDQNFRAVDSRHALEADPAAMPDRYAPVVRHLQVATPRPDLRHLMLTEEEIIGARERLYRENWEQQEALAEQQKTLPEREAAIADNRQSIADQQETLAARDRTIDAQRVEAEALRRHLGDSG